MKARPRSISDKERILLLEREFGITFKKHEDLTAKEMEEKLLEERSKLSEGNNNNGLLVFIMTHGSDNDMLYGSDGETIPLKQLVEIFENDKCKELVNKPKIFIIHACRGEGVDRVDASPEGVVSIREGVPQGVSNGTYV